MNVLFNMSKGDITKIDLILSSSYIFVFNWLSLSKEKQSEM